MINNVFLIGNLTKDTEFNKAQNGIEVCKFSIAVNRRIGEETDFFNVVAFNKLAELCDKYLAKGKKVAVFGRIQTGSYEKDGQKRYTTDIIAEEVEFLTPQKSNTDNF